MVGCTKELWAWPHPWGVAGAKVETAWGYRPGEGVCTRSHMAHAGHTLTGPKPNNIRSGLIEILLDLCVSSLCRGDVNLPYETISILSLVCSQIHVNP